MSFGSSRDDETPLRRAKDVQRAERLIEFQCPVHRDQVIAVITRERILVTGYEEVSIDGVHRPRLSHCRMCRGGSFEYMIDVKSALDELKSNGRRPLVVVAASRAE